MGQVGQNRGHLGPPDALILSTRPESHPKEPDAGRGMGHAFGNQRHFRAFGAALHQQQFYPVADRANRADKVMANTGAYKGGKVRLVGHGRGPWNGDDMASILEPGMMVRLPSQPDWGLGQVQSVVKDRVTVNFEHAGKVVLDAKVVDLQPDFSH